MQLKSVPTCVTFAWSPRKNKDGASSNESSMIAAATFAGTVDEDFSNESFLQLYAVDVTRTEETGLPPLGRIPLPERVNRLDWSVHGGGEGVVAVALVSGEVQFYSVDAILAGHVQGPLYSIKEHHVGVRACQFNPAQTSLIAIGSDDGKWFVWSLPSGPSGAPQKVALIKNSAQETGVVHVQWHPKFPHIIATSTVGGVVSVWNLKNTSLVAKVGLSRYGNGAYANCVVWHPTVATIFAAGLNEVHSTIQLWDLKKASAPETELEGHVGGVTALDWGGPEDSMLVSCGADGTTFLWESATWKKMGELERQESVIDVRWCPQMETVLAAASLTPLLSVSTIVGAVRDTDKAPEWLHNRPCGASVNVFGKVVAVPGGGNALQVLTLPVTADPFELQQNAVTDEWYQPLLDRLTELKATNKRTPIVEYLSVEEATTAAAGDGEDPFDKLQEETHKSFEDRATEMVAKGQLEEAVNLCLEQKRFDDAFSIAFLRNDLMPLVHQQFVAHVTRQHPERRHVLFAGAIASGDFTNLIQANVPWREVLSAIASFVGDDFQSTCHRLGEYLREKNEMEGALVCFTCSESVNEVAELLMMLHNVPGDKRSTCAPEQIKRVTKVVKTCLELEQVAQREITHPRFMQALSLYANHLLAAGETHEAIHLLARVAASGDVEAAATVDQYQCVCRVSNPPDILSQFPYEPISDQPSPSCEDFLALLRYKYEQEQALQQQQRQAQQQQQQQQQWQQQQQQQQQRPPFGQPQAQQQPPLQQQRPPSQPAQQQQWQQPAPQQTQQRPPLMAQQRPPAPQQGFPSQPTPQQQQQQPPAPQQQWQQPQQRPPLMAQQAPPTPLQRPPSQPAQPQQWQQTPPQQTQQRPPLMAPQQQQQPPQQQWQQPPPPQQQQPPYQGAPPSASTAPPARTAAAPPPLMPKSVSNYTSSSRAPSNPNLPPPPRPGEARQSPMPTAPPAASSYPPPMNHHVDSNARGPSSDYPAAPNPSYPSNNNSAPYPNAMPPPQQQGGYPGQGAVPPPQRQGPLPPSLGRPAPGKSLLPPRRM